MRAFTIVLGFLLTLVSFASLRAQEGRTTAEASVSWKDDAPGVSRYIKPANLPSPSLHKNDPEEPDFRNQAKVVPAPEGKMPEVPKGFAAQVFASGLKKPRVIRIAPNGDVFVAESDNGRVVVFPPDTAGAQAAPDVFADKLDRPYGIVFYPPRHPKYIYVAAANQVVRYPYGNGNRKASGPAEVIIADIPTVRHWTRDLEVSPDGDRLFISIGSASNVATTMPKKTNDEIQAYEKTHGLGAAWGNEENRAVVRVFDPEGKTLRNYATGQILDELDTQTRKGNNR